jgi:hypothetical protein
MGLYYSENHQESHWIDRLAKSRVEGQRFQSFYPGQETKLSVRWRFVPDIHTLSDILDTQYL